jgi:hypothetical protein
MPAEKSSNSKSHDAEGMGSKKPYTKPELVIHGTVDKITESSTGSGNTFDFQQNISNRSK